MIDVSPERLLTEIDCLEGGLMSLPFRRIGCKLWYGCKAYFTYSRSTGLLMMYSFNLETELAFLEARDAADFVRLNLHLFR